MASLSWRNLDEWTSTPCSTVLVHPKDWESMNGCLEQTPKIKVGVVGAGYMAGEYCKVIAEHPSYELLGVVSRSPERSRALAERHGLSWFPENLDQLSKDGPPDLIIVAVSEHVIYDVVKELIRLPSVLLVEKPLGLSLNEADELNKLSQRFAGRLFVALNRRFYSSTMRLRAELSSVEGKRGFLLQDQHDQISAEKAGFDPRTVRNWAFANAIHTLDLLSFLGRGEPVVDFVQKTPLDGESFVLEAQISFSSGDSAHYFSVWNAPGPWILNVHSGRARWVMGPLEVLERQPEGSRERIGLVGPGEAGEYKPGLWNMLSELKDYWGGIEPQLPDSRESLRSMKLVADIYGERDS